MITGANFAPTMVEKISPVTKERFLQKVSYGPNGVEYDATKVRKERNNLLFVVRGVWCVVCGVWCVVCGVW